jgi:hypothetical protein
MHRAEVRPLPVRRGRASQLAHLQQEKVDGLTTPQMRSSERGEELTTEIHTQFLMKIALKILQELLKKSNLLQKHHFWNQQMLLCSIPKAQCGILGAENSTQRQAVLHQTAACGTITGCDHFSGICLS